MESCSAYEILLKNYDIRTIVGEPVEKQIKLEATDDSIPGDCINTSNYDVTAESSTQVPLPPISISTEGKSMILEPTVLSHAGTFDVRIKACIKNS